jgi:hypothetical protein
MKFTVWMLSGSILVSFGISTLFRNAAPEIWLGMLGPLAAALASWIAIKRQFTKRPEELTGQLIKAFAAKMVFYPAYVSVLIKLGSVRPVPFVVSFLSYFVLLHVVEAIGLHRLQRAGLSNPWRVR